MTTMSRRNQRRARQAMLDRTAPQHVTFRDTELDAELEEVNDLPYDPTRSLYALGKPEPKAEPESWITHAGPMQRALVIAGLTILGSAAIIGAYLVVLLSRPVPLL